MVQFDGIWVPLVTPFRGGALDPAALARLTRHLATQGVAGFVVCGSTGEAAMLDEDEQAAVLRTVLDAGGGKPVPMGLSGIRPETVAARARRLAEAHPALAGYLLSAPAYVKPGQAGLLEFFRQVADASPRPIVAYDIPARTGVRIAAETLLVLAAHPNIVGVKDCSSDPAAATRLIADGRIALLAGNDDELFAQLALGAAGAITASAHLRPDLFVRLHDLLGRQQLAAARQLWQALRPLVEVLFAEPNPAPVKALLARQGWIADELRAPMTPATDAGAARAEAALQALERSHPAPTRH